MYMGTLGETIMSLSDFYQPCIKRCDCKCVCVLFKLSLRCESYFFECFVILHIVFIFIWLHSLLHKFFLFKKKHSLCKTTFSYGRCMVHKITETKLNYNMEFVCYFRDIWAGTVFDFGEIKVILYVFIFCIKCSLQARVFLL